MFGKGLVYKFNPFIQYTMVRNYICCIPGHEKTFNIRVQVIYLFGQVPAIHFRHNDIGHQQMKVMEVQIACYLNSLSGCGC